MNNLTPTIRCSLLILAACASFTLSSCSRTNSRTTADVRPLPFPATFEESGMKWTKSATIDQANLKVLHNYFKKNSALAENPLISGEPTLYTSPKGTRRFYWGNSSPEQTQWIYVHFEGRTSKLLQGSGGPFSESEETGSS